MTIRFLSYLDFLALDFILIHYHWVIALINSLRIIYRLCYCLFGHSFLRISLFQIFGRLNLCIVLNFDVHLLRVLLAFFLLWNYINVLIQLRHTGLVFFGCYKTLLDRLALAHLLVFLVFLWFESIVIVVDGFRIRICHLFIRRLFDYFFYLLRNSFFIWFLYLFILFLLCFKNWNIQFLKSLLTLLLLFISCNLQLLFITCNTIWSHLLTRFCHLIPKRIVLLFKFNRLVHWIVFNTPLDLIVGLFEFFEGLFLHF